MIRAVAEGFGRHPVDRVHLEQWPELAACRSVGLRAGRALDQVALPEPVLPDLRGRDIYVVRAAAVAGDADEGVAVGRVDEAGHRDASLGLFNLSPGGCFLCCCCHK